MKIELKRIAFDERLSEESNCFVADLFINGNKIGIASNGGDGESTVCIPDKKDSRMLISSAIKYCESLPPQKAEFGGEYLEFKMDLSTYLDDLVNRYVAVRALKAYNLKIKRGTGKHIVYADQDLDFLVLRFKKEFVDITSFKVWKEELVNNIRSTVKAIHIDGKLFFVTNMPEDMCRRAGLKPLQHAVTSSRAKKHKIGRKPAGY